MERVSVMGYFIVGAAAGIIAMIIATVLYHDRGDK